VKVQIDYYNRYYNAGERPTVEILYKQPELMHRVKLRLGVAQLMDELKRIQGMAKLGPELRHDALANRSPLLLGSSFQRVSGF
jgi:hypothetical protein